MARKKSKKELDMDEVELDENGEPIEDEGGGKLTSIIIGIVVILIWLAIFALLIKMDVGGVGTMLRPYLKNVPVINQILPDASSEEIEEETGYKFNSLAEAVDRIKQLEKELETYQNSSSDSAQKIAELQAEIDRLKVYEENQEYYDQLKDEFDREVVYTDNAPDIEEYKKWYEAMDPDNAAEIYAEVVERIQTSAKVTEWAEAFSKMDAENAAAILEEMTGDTDLVAEILMSMTSKQRAAILAEMDTVFAAKMTKIMYPN
jgi:flagellar motility protein MotE (MotC chaperone)